MILIITILFLIVLCLSRLISDSLLHPVRVFAFMWTGFVLVPFWLWDTGYQWQYLSSFWILLAVISMEIGAFIGKSIAKNRCMVIKNSEGRKEEILKKKVSFVWIIILIGFGLFYIMLFFIKNQISVTMLKTFQGFLAANKMMAARRYGGGAITSIMMQILLIFVYAAPASGGYAYNFAKNRKEKILSILTILPIVIKMLLENTKAGFIISIALWLGGFAASYLYIYGRLPKVKMALFIKLFLMGGCLAAILYFLLLLRAGDFSKNTLIVTYHKFLNYAFGQMIQFDGWFAQEAGFLEDGFGRSTYMWIFIKLGLVERIQGVYTPYVNGYTSNVFTSFRGVIEDFGIVFGLIYMVFRGVIVEYAYVCISVRKRVSIILIMLVVSAYLYEIFGFVISAWAYTTDSLAIIVFGIFLFMFHRRIKLRVQ